MRVRFQGILGKTGKRIFGLLSFPAEFNDENPQLLREIRDVMFTIILD
ncbi:hypothetical protein M595_2950 [Lyngbya aestuarii BL J]|uniref:Uncharacterized protein n=1 Tax=Lyngbya aestuarii BL J TaxID=1348334 RepID=U7QIJ3_9CYAN|nr:hypothetical protein M595_2950 [Lyngbya aestuarii BL J]